MEYRQLAHTELNVSRLSFGTMPFGSQADQVTSTRMVDQCLDAGINFFDTANMYNMGKAETVLGNTLKGRRDRVIVATKVRNKMGDGPDDAGLSRNAIHKALHASLERLQTDYVDVYYAHWPDNDIPIEETLATMDDLIRGGKVRYFAISNYAAWQIVEIHWACERNGYKAPHISQPMYNLVARGIEDEYLPFCKRFGVAVLPYNPLAGGLLTGKHAHHNGPIAGTRFDKNDLYLRRYWHEDYFDSVEELKGIASDCGMTLIELSLRWLLSQPIVDSVILGASRPEQLAENLKSCEGGSLDQGILDKCDAVWKKLRGITPKYNR